jgi:HEAT repeat protein
VISLATAAQASFLMAMVFIILTLASRAYQAWARVQVRRLTPRLSVMVEQALRSCDEVPPQGRRLRRWEQRAFDQVVLNAARHASPQQRARLAHLTRRLGQTDRYLDHLGSLWPDRRTEAAEALRWLGDGAAVPEMLRSMYGKPWTTDLFTTAQAVTAHATSQAQIRAVLLYLLRYPNITPRLAAAIADKTTLVVDQVVMEFLADPDDTLCITALELLRSRVPVAIPIPWQTLFKHRNVDVRCAGIRLYLASNAEPAAVQRACQGSYLDDWRIRTAIAAELWRVQSPWVFDHLEQMLEDSAWWVRYRAARSLARLQPLGALVLRQVATRTTDGFARDMALDTLAEIAFEQGTWDMAAAEGAGGTA